MTISERVAALEAEVAALRAMISEPNEIARVQTPEQARFEIQQLAGMAQRSPNGFIMIDVTDHAVPTWKLKIWAKHGYIARQYKHYRWMKKDVGRCQIAVYPDVLASSSPVV